LIEPEQRRRGPNLTQEIRATLTVLTMLPCYQPWTDTDGSWTKRSTKSLVDTE